MRRDLASAAAECRAHTENESIVDGDAICSPDGTRTHDLFPERDCAGFWKFLDPLKHTTAAAKRSVPAESGGMLRQEREGGCGVAAPSEHTCGRIQIRE